ncbi:MAG: hypothetical protein AAGH42_05030 [Pseudomonadota bacterium]
MFDHLTLADAIGFVGVGFVVGTYFLSQIGRMTNTGIAYPLINGIGALLILYSLWRTPNAASIVIEVFWLGISIVGFALALRRRTKTNKD